MIVATFKRLRMFRMFLAAMPLMSKGGRLETIMSLMEAVIPNLVSYERLPFDKLKVTDFAVFWNALVALSDKLLADIPSDRLLNLKFEDMQAEPEAQLRRLIRFIDPSLEDEEWIQEASTIPRPTIAKFSTLSAEDQDMVVEACRPGLKRLGYPV